MQRARRVGVHGVERVDRLFLLHARGSCQLGNGRGAPQLGRELVEHRERRLSSGAGAGRASPTPCRGSGGESRQRSSAPHSSRSTPRSTSNRSKP
jgi:hypothetical protein